MEVEILSSVNPIKFEGNRGEKVNTLLLIKRWNLDTLKEAMTLSYLQGDDLGLVARIAVQLSEFDFHLVERAVSRVGSVVCQSVLDQVLALVAKESPDTLIDFKEVFFTVDGRRRTPGGIFWKLFKSSVSGEDSKFVFKDNTKRQQGIRRSLVRDRWTENHLTCLKKQKTNVEIDAVKTIAKTLSMSEVSIIERLVVKRSVEYAMEVLKETEAIVSEGKSELAVVLDAEKQISRRRTPGGVFAQLIKIRSDLSESEKRFIFAKARGGRAPSMSDLISMSLAMVDRPLKSSPQPKPVDTTDAWEFQTKVGNVWEPGFIGSDNFSDSQFPECLHSDSWETCLGKIAAGLKIYNETDFIDRLVRLVDSNLILSVYRETVLLEQKGGLTLAGSSRRRTPKGVFIALLKKSVPANTMDALLKKGEDFLAPLASDGWDPVTRKSKLADKIVVELERLRVPESDYEIVRSVVELKGETYVRNLFERVRKRFNKGKWLDTPGQLFARMLKSPVGGLSNDELNRVFESARFKQEIRNLKRAPKIDTLEVSSNLSVCVREVTVGLALIGVTASDVGTIERVVQRLGEEVAKNLLLRTREIELEGGQRTRDNMRRKTPTGVYLSLLLGERISAEDSKFIFEKKLRNMDERKKEDTHFAPSLFTPVNPFRVIDNSGKDPLFLEQIKKEIRPCLAQLEYISVLDPRLETVVRALVLLGPSVTSLVDKCVFTFGEKRTEGWLEISHSQVADEKISKEALPNIYNELVKAAGGLPEETTGAIRC